MTPEERRAYGKEYYRRPEVNLRLKTQRDTPEAKAKVKAHHLEYYSKPENKKRAKEYAKKYSSSPARKVHIKANRKIWGQSPKGRALNKLYKFRRRNSPAAIATRNLAEIKRTLITRTRIAIRFVIDGQEKRDAADKRKHTAHLKKIARDTVNEDRRIGWSFRFIFDRFIKTFSANTWERRYAVLGNDILNPELADAYGFDGHHIDLKHILYIPSSIHLSVPHDNINGDTESMERINTKAYCWLLGYYSYDDIVWPEPLRQVDAEVLQYENMLGDLSVYSYRRAPPQDGFDTAELKELTDALTSTD